MHPTLKRQLKKLPIFAQFHSFWNYHVTGRTRNDPTENIRRTLRIEAPQVVQIGSNDGKTGDPIYPLFTEKWRGLFVEPLPYFMEKLQENYRFSTKAKFQQSVINDGSEATFYFIDPQAKLDHPELPHWVDQLGSLNSNHIFTLPDMLEKILPYRHELRVSGMTFDTLLKLHDIHQMDLLHIDAEGFDWQILSQVDFTRFTPQVVLYEHKCLSDEERSASVAFMSRHYRLRDLGADMFCVRR